MARERLGDSWGAVGIRLETLQGVQRRLALWLIAAEYLALAEYRLEDHIDGLQMLTFGVDEGDRDSSPRITAYVLPEAFADNEQRILPDLLVGGQDDEGLVIPVVPEPWELTLHAPLNLLYATLGCWVKPNAGGDGIVTVRHAVASHRVHLDDGSVQRVLWYAPGCLDAAVATAPCGRVLANLPTAVPMADDAVEVFTKRGAQARRVAHIGQTYGTFTSAIPHSFLLDRPLERGDSGSLVRLSGPREALGLYVGSLFTSRGPRGFCQGLDQIDRLFSAEGNSHGFYEESTGVS